MKRGFTLIELLAVIIILSLIAGIAVTSVSKVINDSKNNLKEVQIEEVKKAANKYILNTEEDIEDGNSMCVNISQLIELGYFETDNIEDPTTGEDLTGSVNISRTGEQYFYEYSSAICEGE